MRHVNLRVYEDKQDDVESVLEDHDLDYVTIRDEGDEDEDSGMLFLFPLPNQAVTDVFHDINEVGVSEDAYTVLTDASHAATPRYSEIQEKYATEVRGLSRRELHSKVQELSWPPITYYVGTVLSVIVATVGLLLDSPAVIIGAMVIAPQVSSALTMTAGVYHGDWKMFVRAAKRQSVGLTLAVVGAAIFAWVAQVAGFVPSAVAIDSLELMGIRLAPTSLSTIAALATGAVGAFGYTTDQSMSLVGVMIAAAIIPAAAAGGIAFAWGSWLVAVGALLLLTVNMLAINVGAIVMLYCMGYQPIWFDRTNLKATLPSQGLTTIGAVAVLLLLAVVVTGSLVGTHVQYERATNTAVDETFDEPQYSELTLQSVQSEYGGWPGMSPNVSVTVKRTTNETYSSLPNALERHIERQTGRDVRVTVQYAETRSADRRTVDADARLPKSSAARPVAI